MMKSLFLDAMARYFRYAVFSFFPGADSPARLSFRRFVMISGFLPLFLLLQLSHWLGFLFDEIFFSGYRGIVIREPLFIVGVPRSGTTFFHRLLSEDKARFTTCMLWELFFAPSIMERKLIMGIAGIDRIIGRPLGRIMKAIDRLLLGKLDDMHATGLNVPEEDYLFLIPVYACFLMVLPFPSAGELWRLSRFDEEVPEEERRRIMAFYRACVQKHLYVRGPEKQYLSKNPHFSSMVMSLWETFPDARIIACFRSPYRVVPSLLSTMMTGAAVFDNDPRGTEYRDRLIEVLRYYYHYIPEQLSGIPENQYAVMTMDDLKADPEGMVLQLYRNFGWKPDLVYRKILRREYKYNREHQSNHHYTLEQFQLEPEILYQKMKTVFGQFGFDIQD